LKNKLTGRGKVIINNNNINSTDKNEYSMDSTDKNEYSMDSTDKNEYSMDDILIELSKKIIDYNEYTLDNLTDIKLNSYDNSNSLEITLNHEEKEKIQFTIIFDKGNIGALVQKSLNIYYLNDNPLIFKIPGNISYNDFRAIIKKLNKFLLERINKVNKELNELKDLKDTLQTIIDLLFD
jgi:hypothetical protein